MRRRRLAVLRTKRNTAPDAVIVREPVVASAKRWTLTTIINCSQTNLELRADNRQNERRTRSAAPAWQPQEKAREIPQVLAKPRGGTTSPRDLAGIMGDASCKRDAALRLVEREFSQMFA
jgi:hypothetical protein